MLFRSRSQAGTGAGLQSSITGGDIGFHPDDGAKAGLPCLFLELPRGVHVAVISDRQRRLLQLLGSPDQIIDAVGAVEE